MILMFFSCFLFLFMFNVPVFSTELDDSSLVSGIVTENQEFSVKNDNDESVSSSVVLGNGETKGDPLTDTTEIETVRDYQAFYKEFIAMRYDLTQLLQYILIFTCVGAGAVIGSCCLRFVRYD